MSKLHNIYKLDEQTLIRIEVLWPKRANSQVRHLLRVYLGERRDQSGSRKDMAAAVAQYYKPGMDDYVINPTLVFYMRLLIMDIDFNSVVSHKELSAVLGRRIQRLIKPQG
jgi:hypothetical protein